MEKENEALILKIIKEIFGEYFISYEAISPNKIFVEIKRENFKFNIKRLIEKLDIWHISTITGTDFEDSIELMYHLWCDKYKTLISIKLKLPKDNPVIESISDIMPGAVLYEREVYDMLGVQFLGHPMLEHLLLPEDWPRGVYPLRKEVPLEKVRKIMLEGSEKNA